MIWSDIWHKYHEWYFEIVWNLRQFWNITSGIYAKYHVQIMLLFAYTTTHEKFVLFTCRYFKLSWNTTALSQSNCRNFSCSSISVVIQESLGFWIPLCGFRIPGTGFQVFCQWNSDSGFHSLTGFRILVSRVLDSGFQGISLILESRLPDKGQLEPRVQHHKQNHTKWKPSAFHFCMVAVLDFHTDRTGRIDWYRVSPQERFPGPML